MPSLRARIVKQGLRAAVKAQRAAAADPLLRDDATAEEMEAALAHMRAQIEQLAEYAYTSRRVVTEALGEPVPSEWVEHPPVQPDRVVLHLHGGGYVMCSPDTHRGMAALMSKVSRARVLVPDYRLAPEHRFPAALDDAVATYRWLLEDEGIDPGRLAVTGDSAGGGLGLALLVRARDEGLPLPACYVGLSPWTDLAGTGGSMQSKDGVDPWLSARLVPPAANAYAGDAPLDDPLVSPLYADLRGLPPLLLQVGSDEILLDDSRRLVERARDVGVTADVHVFDGLWHVFQAFPVVPEAKRAWREIGAFIRRHTARSWQETTRRRRVA